MLDITYIDPFIDALFSIYGEDAILEKVIKRYADAKHEKSLYSYDSFINTLSQEQKIVLLSSFEKANKAWEDYAKKLSNERIERIQKDIEELRKQIEDKTKNKPFEVPKPGPYPSPFGCCCLLEKDDENA